MSKKAILDVVLLVLTAGIMLAKAPLFLENQ